MDLTRDKQLRRAADYNGFSQWTPEVSDEEPEDDKPSGTGEQGKRLTVKGLRAWIASQPDVDLMGLATALLNQLNGLPEFTRSGRRSVSLHVAATPATVRLLVELAEKLCR